MKKSNEQQAARDLFFQTDHSQAEIARQIGVDPKTVNLWVKHGKWKEIKMVARRTPAILVEQYFNQLAELNNSIGARPEGERFASLKEAETMRKLLVCINNVQKQTSLGANIDVMQNLISRIERRDHELAKLILPYGDEYLKSRDYNGISSYEVAYDTGDEQQQTLASLPAQPAAGQEALPAGQPGIIKRSHDDISIPGHDQTPTDNHQQHRQYIGNEQATNSPLEVVGPASMNIDIGRGNVDDHHEQSPTNETGSYPPKCIRDPDDPYTFYYDKITRRRFGSPKYGRPPDGFREVPKKDPVSKRDIRGAGRYNWL
jgi:hypothetical protein